MTHAKIWWLSLAFVAAIGCGATDLSVDHVGSGGDPAPGVGGTTVQGTGGAPAREGTGGQSFEGVGGALVGVGGRQAGTGGTAPQGTGGAPIVLGTGGTAPVSGTGGGPACSPDEGAACACGGKIGCDGQCSVIVPADYGQPCGLCHGTVSCTGACSIPDPAPAGDYTTKTMTVSPGAGGSTISVGGPCGVGYDRLDVTAVVAGTGSYPQRGTCSATWTTSDPTSCTATVEVTPGTTFSFQCAVTVRRVGVCP